MVNRLIIALAIASTILMLPYFASAAQVEAEVTRLEEVEDPVEDFKVTLEARVKNTGEVSLDRNCYVRFYVRGPKTNRYVGYAKLENEEGELEEDERRWYEITWTPKYPGEYRYWAIVWCNGFNIGPWSDPEEFYVEENTAEAEILELEEIEDAVQGTPVKLEARVENTGDIDLMEGCKVWFYVKGTNTAGYVGYEEIESKHKPDRKRWYSFEWTPRYSGFYKYWARVYCGDKKVSDWSESEIFKVERKIRKPEIISTFHEWSAEDNKTTLWALVQNQGNIALGKECVVKYWVRGEGANKYLGTVSMEYGGVLYEDYERWYGMQYAAKRNGTYRFWARTACYGANIGDWYPEGGSEFTVT